jgi:NAD(P)-dependent dehydrogenase (short-subunit alcohol dehydrogenase family)
LEVLGIHLVVPFVLIQLLLPERRIGEAAEIAGAVAFLASDKAACITTTSIPVSGGWVYRGDETFSHPLRSRRRGR